MPRDFSALIFIALTILGGVAAVLLTSWFVFTALVLFAGSRLAYMWAVRRQRR